MLENFRADPLANPLNTPSGRIEIFSKTVSDFGYDDCPGHPVWQEPYEWLGNADPHWPLHLISNQPKDKLHSQMDHGQVSKAKKVNSREPIHINPNDATTRDLKNGDIVKVHNARGACLAGVVIDLALRRGVVQMSTGAWYDPEDPSKPNSLCKHGNPNVLTRDKGTSKLGQGPTAHTCMVNVELYRQALPRVTAHEPPEILRTQTSKKRV
jgi:biotin/methionine sulfoxide reductase